MKRTKAFLSLLLVLMLMAVPISTSAARITVEGDAYTEVKPAGPGNFTKYGGLLCFGTGHTFTYPATVGTAGEYHISVRAGASAETTMNMTVGEQTISVIMNTGSATVYKEYYVGKLTLAAGENLFKVVNTVAGTIGLQEIFLEKAAERVDTNFQRTEGPFRSFYLPTTIEAEDFDMGATGNYSTATSQSANTYRETTSVPILEVGDGYQVSLRTNEWTKYTFNVSDEGSYDLSVKTASPGNLYLYFDDQTDPIVVSASEAGVTNVDTVLLEEGVHTLKVAGVDIKTEVDAIIFKDANKQGVVPSELGTNLAEAEVEIDDNMRPVWHELWVSASAAPGGDGSKDKPFKTIEEAKAAVRTLRDAMKGDIHVQIMPGEYELAEKLVFNEQDGGKNGYRVVYQGVNALERPIISGGTHVTGWQPYKNGVWKVNLPNVEDMRQLYINGYAGQRARSKYIYTFGSGYDDPTNEYALDGYTVDKRNFPVLTNVSEVEIVFNQLWTLQRAPVKEIIEGEGNTWIVVCDQPHFNGIQTNYNKDITPLPGSKGYLENAYELLDEQGEFYFDKTTRELFYMPYPEEDLRTAETVIGRTELMADVMGSSKNSRITGLTFNNLDFRYGTWLDASRTGISTFQADCIVDENYPASNVQGNGRNMPAVIQVRYAKDITIKNCNFQNLGASAIFMDEHVNDSRVTGNVFRDISGTAVAVGTWRVSAKKNTPDDLTSNIYITNNVLRRTGLEYCGSPGIGVYYARNVITEHNDIMDTPYTGITYGWGWGSSTPKELDCSGHSISYNRIVDNSNVVKDGGPIYTLGEMRNTFIQYNYLTDSRDFGGIYFDSGSAMMTCRFNVLEGMQQSGIFGAGSNSYGMTITDNWSDNPNPTRTSFAAKDSTVLLPNFVYDGNWPEEAREVMKNAGLERGYKRLLANTGYPEWRTENWEFEYSINEFYKSVNIIEKLCYEWMEGGEGVAYHETKEGTEPRVYDLGLNVSVGDTNDGEWLAYEIDVKKEGNYDLEVTYSYLSSSKDSNVKSTTGLNFYVDGKKVIDSFMLANTGSWNAYLPTMVDGKVHLTEGKHIIKLEFINAFAFEKLKLIHEEFVETEPEFDDAILLSRKGD